MERSVLVRRSAPVAVFAAVLGGLVALGARGGGGGARTSRDLDPVPLSMGFRAEGAPLGAPRDSAASGSTRAAYWGEIVIPDALLTGVPTEGPVRTVTPGDTSRIAALADALGVPGAVRSDSEGWVVGDGDVVLRVMRGPGHPWYLGTDKVSVGVGVAAATPATSEPKPEPTGDDTPVSDECGKTAGETCPDPMPADCPPPPDGAEPACEVPAPRPLPEPSKPPQPTDDEARAVAQRVFDAVGVSGTITFNDAWSGKEVVAAPVVAGLPTVGFETRVTVEDGGRVQYAAGFLGGTEDGGTYPLLAPRAAVERGGAYGAYGTRPMIDIACPPEEPCPTPEPREATRLRLGLMFMTSYDGTEAFLAPAWLLTFEGGTWEEPVLALPDRYIETPPPASDSPGTIEPGTIEPDAPVASDGGGSSGSGGSADGSTGAPE